MTRLTNCDEKLAQLKEIIYKAKVENGLNFVDIATMLHIPSSTAKALFLQAKALHIGGDYSWLEGLSNRAITQIKKTKYTDFNSLCFDVLNDKIDLQDYPWIGRKVASEVRKWCKTKPNKIDGDRRTCERRIK